MLLSAFLLFAGVAFSQVTTATMNGRITGNNGETLPGANILAVHTPTGTQYGTVTDVQGYYHIPNMNVGGPYTVTISYVGYAAFTKKDVYLTLGQTYKLSVQLAEKAIDVSGVEVVAVKKDIFDGNMTGAETVIREEAINVVPTVSRDIFDFVRLTPQARFDGTQISIAGANNRYNSISIDGAINNDAFGLAENGQNGGQTGGTPFSMDAIEQFQVVLAPFDVRYNGFTGGGINAVTRSGTNDITGSAYFLMRNEGIAGKTPTDDPDLEREKLAEFSAATYGFRVGGPILKNKLFFFVSAEMQRDETPQPFNFDDYLGDSDEAKIAQIKDKLMNDYGYNPGDYLNNVRELNSEKIFAKLDWNINNVHRLSFRHSYTNNEATNPYSSSSRSINFYNNGVYFPSKANSTTLEFKSNFRNMSNNLILGYNTVLDDRNQMGDPFPAVQLRDGGGTIYFGSEPYSTANKLDQKIFTISDNFTIYKGKHTFTIGTANEFTSVYNLFMRKNFGEFIYNSVDGFLNNEFAYQYERGYSLVDDITGDGSAAAAEFNMMQFSIYAQDEFQVKSNLKLTYGIRFDMPTFTTDPGVDADFNEKTIPVLEEAGWDLMGAKSGQMPGTQLLFSPRFGFNWDVKEDKTLQVRGGAGIFTSRLPLVWPGGSYTNNGITIGGVYVRAPWGYDIPFEPNWDQQYDNTYFGEEDAIPSGQIDLFSEDFKYPQVFRTSLAVDNKLPWWGLIGTFEVLYTKTLNNVLYYNLNLAKDPLYDLTGADNRPYYSDSKLDDTYTRIILGTNTSEGSSYNITASIQKPLEKGFAGSLAYTFGRSKSMNDGTSSQNSSQWRYMETVNGLNNLDLSYSDFDLGHRVLAFLSYRLEYANHFASTFSLVFNGQSGDRFSYVYNDYGDLNGEGENSGNLIWIPNAQDQINLVPIVDGDGNVTKTPEQQWENLAAFIESDKYLADNKGGYAERNGARLPFESVIDFKFAQDIYVNTGDRRQTLQLTFDIFNFTNLLNKDWGRRHYIGNDALRLIDFEGFDADGTTPQFSYDGPADAEEYFNIDDSGVFSSRWQGQIGVRYIFN